MYTGLTGALKIVDILGQRMTVAYVSGWSVDAKTEMIDCSQFGSAETNKIAGRKSWSASAEGAVCFAENADHRILFEKKAAGLPLELEFYLDVGENGTDPESTGTFLCGSGYIESLSLDLSAGDKGNISISISGDGPLDVYTAGSRIGSGDASEKTLEFFIKDKNLFVKGPIKYKNNININENGHLIVKVE